MKKDDARTDGIEGFRLRDDKLGRKLGSGPLTDLNATDSPWHETKREIRDRLRWGRLKAERLRWVRSQMAQVLSLKERRCIRLYYFRGLTYRQIGEKLDVNVTSVYRAVNRGVQKLRQAAIERGEE